MSPLVIIVQGGVGDLIETLPWLEALNFKLQRYHILRIYSNFPELIQHFLPWAYKPKHKSKFDDDNARFQYWIEVSDVVKFQLRPKAVLPSQVKKLYDIWMSKLGLWGHLIGQHPRQGVLLGKLALSEKLNRRTLPCHLLDLPFAEFNYSTTPIKTPKQFITIHDGFDGTNWYKFHKATKSWELEHWNEFVSCFKQFYPGIAVVQLGGQKARKIEGVDLNMVLQTDFETTLQWLMGSMIHVDGDSGLVHARHLFRKPSIVMFGPTDSAYFGYPENFNIKAPECGECWWSTDNWMEKCPAGLQVPVCMNSIKPALVLERVAIIFAGNRP